jgi:membrane-associated HD superfamily phosphohydrolase
LTKLSINNGGYRKKKPLTRLINMVRRKTKPQSDKRDQLRQFPWRRICLLLLLASFAGLLGISLLVLLLLVILFEFATTNIRKFARDDKDLLFLSVLLVALLGVTKVSLALFPFIGQALPEIPPSAYVYGIGMAAGAMLVRLVLNSESALVFSVVASLFAGWLTDNSFLFLVYFFIGSIVGAHSVGYGEDRNIILKAGAKVGLANVMTILCSPLWLFRGGVGGSYCIGDPAARGVAFRVYNQH